jgi:HEAT repeat protein
VIRKMDKVTAKAIKNLGNHFPLIGSLFRAKGARALINTEEQQAVLPLIQALKDKSPKVSQQPLRLTA